MHLDQQGSLESAPPEEISRIVWAGVAAKFLRDRHPTPPMASALNTIALHGPDVLDRAVDAKGDELVPVQAARYVVEVLEALLDFGSLSDDDVNSMRRVQRIFRLDEGEVASLEGEAVGKLLVKEVSRILEDGEIDTQEALHKVSLQAALGLAFDDFLRLSRPAVIAFMEEVAEFPGSSPHAINALSQLQSTLRLYQVEADETRGPDPGFLYVAVNPSIEGVVKVGLTRRLPTERMAELSSASGIPTPFVLVFHVPVPDVISAERTVHQELERQGLRVASNREFFRCAPEIAIRSVMDVRSPTW